jgi:hypothetical protein
LTPDILTAFLGLHDAYLVGMFNPHYNFGFQQLTGPKDFHKVWVQWANITLKAKIYTNTEVTRIGEYIAFLNNQL